MILALPVKLGNPLPNWPPIWRASVFKSRNFRRYVVKREGKDHYHYDATVIRVEDGVIICPDKKYEPTDEERIHIEAEIAAQIELKLWPHSITAHSADALRDMLPKDAVLYEYLTENGKEWGLYNSG